MLRGLSPDALIGGATRECPSGSLRSLLRGNRRDHTPSYTSLVKKPGSMAQLPNLASKAAVGFAATVSSRVLPCFLRAATFSRTPTSMSRNSLSSALLLTGRPCPGMMIVLSVVAARLASDAAIAAVGSAETGPSIGAPGEAGAIHPV